MITVAQIFQIGSVLIVLASVIVGHYYVTEDTTIIFAAILTAWNGVGAILTGQNAQVKQVSNMEGVEHVRLNNQAGPSLMAMAASKEKDLENIVPPKGPPPPSRT
jgi:hypothetical protein